MGVEEIKPIHGGIQKAIEVCLTAVSHGHVTPIQGGFKEASGQITDIFAWLGTVVYVRQEIFAWVVNCGVPDKAELFFWQLHIQAFKVSLLIPFLPRFLS